MMHILQKLKYAAAQFFDSMALESNSMCVSCRMTLKQLDFHYKN